MSKLGWLVLLTMLISMPLHAEREITIGYQGVVATKGVDVPATATGLFKFVLCDKDCITTYWSNDGTSVAGSEPKVSVSLTVVKGVFSVLLGDAAAMMAPIPITIFEDLGDKDLYLRVWYDDGTNKFEEFKPDQKLPLVPYATKAEVIGSLSDMNSVAMKGDLGMTGALSIESSKPTASTLLFKAEGISGTLFSISGNGTASARSFDLQPLTSAAEISRVEAGRLFYDSNLNKFMGCNNTSCAEIGLAGATGVADITSVAAGSGVTGGGVTGDLTFTIDTGVIVAKSGDHTMTGSLTAASLIAPTVSSTTMNTTTMTVTDAITANSTGVTGMTTSLGHILLPTGTDVGNTAELRTQELAANDSNYVGFKAQDSILTNKIWTLPTTDGAVGNLLSTDGLATFEWKAASIGTVTSVTTPLGLSGGGVTGDITLAVGAGNGISVTADTVDINLITANVPSAVADSYSGMQLGGTGGVQLGLLQGCANSQVLKWNNAAATWNCSAITPPTESVMDNTALELTGSYAEVMNSAEPSISPATGDRIWVRGAILLSAAGIDEETSTFRIYRRVFDDTSCSGTQVGVDLSATTSAVGTISVPFSFIDTPSATDRYYTVCGITDGIVSLNTVDNVMLTIQEVPATGADLAELYAATDTSIHAGTVVNLDPNQLFGVRKSSSFDERGMLGVVSTKPGLLMDDGIGSGGVVPVALYGRVPVEVTTHDGADPISVGDYLTLSEILGVAMKAKQSGMVIGKALSRLESGSGRVVMFIEQGHMGGRDAPLAGSVETDANGFATVALKMPINAARPAVQLTVEQDSLVFAQVAEYLRDALGNTTGFVIKTFSPSGAAAPKVVVHHRVMGAEGGHG